MVIHKDGSISNRKNPLIQRLAAIVSNSSDAITVVDLQGNILTWNKGAERIYGYSEKEALKMSIFDITLDPYKLVVGGFLKNIRHGLPAPPRPVESKRISKNGIIIDVLSSMTPLYHNGTVVAVSKIERNITEYKELVKSLREVPRQIIVAQDDERRRIAQKIHDDFGQSLIALKMFVVTALSVDAAKNSRINHAYAGIKKQLGNIIDKARDLSHELLPSSLKYIGLASALEKMIDSLNTDKKLDIRFIHRNAGKIPREVDIVLLYRIAQEALTNLVKHSSATRASVKLIYSPGLVRLEIADNGKGFEGVSMEDKNGVGFVVMRERASLLNGALNIESNSKSGTKITIDVPVKIGKGI